MIKIRYEKYWCDYHKQSCEKSFQSLDDLEEWIFGQMEGEYSRPGVMFFPTPDILKRIGKEEPGRISFNPTATGPSIWIHLIEEYGGVVFSDGKCTSGQKHWSKAVQEWLTHCDARKKTPKFNFVD